MGDDQKQLASAWNIRICDVFGYEPVDEQLADPESLALIEHHVEQFPLEAASAA